MRPGTEPSTSKQLITALRASDWREAYSAAERAWRTIVAPSHTYSTEQMVELIAPAGDWIHDDEPQLRKRLYKALVAGDYDTFRAYTTDRIEDSGQHEVLNWFCLLGAMEELGRKPDKSTFIETWAFVSPVVFAYYGA